MQADTRVPRSGARTRRAVTPKHSQVATILLGQISNGRYKPGDLLPSEPELCRHFGVSRHTVRIALRSLYEKGLIVSQQGRGSVVQAIPLAPRFTFACTSIADLLQYAAATSRRLLDVTRLAVDTALAEWLGCTAGDDWWTVHTCRLQEDGGSTLASSRIYVPGRYADAVRELKISTLPLFVLMETRHGHRIAQVRQRFSVAEVNAEEAQDLALAPGAPVMCVERRFYDERGGLLEVSRSVHPPQAFHYEFTMRQVIGPEPA